MSDAKRRGLRTLFQMILAFLSGGGLAGLLYLFGVELSAEQWGALSAILLPFVTVGQNALEDAGKIPAVLKAPASDGENPVPDDAGQGVVEVLVTVLIVLVLLWAILAVLHQLF